MSGLHCLYIFFRSQKVTGLAREEDKSKAQVTFHCVHMCIIERELCCVWCPQKVGGDVWRDGNTLSGGKEAAKGQTERCVCVSVRVHMRVSVQFYIIFHTREEEEDGYENQQLGAPHEAREVLHCQ